MYSLCAGPMSDTVPVPGCGRSAPRAVAGPAGAEAGVTVPGVGSVAQDVAVSASIQLDRSCSV